MTTRRSLQGNLVEKFSMRNLIIDSFNSISSKYSTTFLSKYTYRYLYYLDKIS